MKMFHELPRSSKDISYSINLMWINLKFDQNRECICDDDRLSEIAASLVEWRKSNPTAKLKLWYDGRFLKEGAVDKTREKLVELGCTDFEMKDIGSIGVVYANPAVFSPQAPFFFRIDLLKLVICLHELEESSLDYTIFSDADLHNAAKTLTKEKLFDDCSVKALETFGMLTNGANGIKGKENQFIQVRRDSSIMNVIKHYINVNLMRGVCALKMPQVEFDDEDLTQEFVMPRLNEAVYFDTVWNIRLYYFAKRRGSIRVNLGLLDSARVNKWEDYDAKKHGYIPFGQYSGTHVWSRTSDGGALVASEVVHFLDQHGKKVEMHGCFLSEGERGSYPYIDVNSKGHTHFDEDFEPTQDPLPDRVQYWEEVSGAQPMQAMDDTAKTDILCASVSKIERGYFDAFEEKSTLFREISKSAFLGGFVGLAFGVVLVAALNPSTAILTLAAIVIPIIVGASMAAGAHYTFATFFGVGGCRSEQGDAPASTTSLLPH